MNQKIKGGKTYDPLSLDFIFKRLLGANKLSLTEHTHTFVNVFEMLLALAVIFGKDQDSKITAKLLKTASKIVKLVGESLEEINGDKLIMSRIINSQVLKWISDGLNFNMTDVNKRKSFIVDMQTTLFQIQGKELARIQKEIEIAANINLFIASSLKNQQIFQDGRNFSHLINMMQLKSLAESPEDSWAILDKSLVY